MKTGFLLLCFVQCLGGSESQMTADCARPTPFVNVSLNASSSQEGYTPESGWVRDHIFTAWCGGEKNKEQWLEVDLGGEKEVIAVALQGGRDDSWVETFYVQYSRDGSVWRCYGTEEGNMLFTGNENADTLKVCVLHIYQILAQHIRINPQTWHGDICLRTLIYGCPYDPHKVYDTDRPPVYKNCRIKPKSPSPTTSTWIPTVEEIVHDMPISALKPRVPDHPIKTAEVIIIGVEPHAGTNVIYHWGLGNENLTISVPVFWHVYNHAGVYRVHVTASNKNNTVMAWSTVVVQEPIQGLYCISNEVAVLPMTEVIIEWVVRHGTNITFNITTDDGHIEIKKSINEHRGPFWVERVFKQAGNYTVSIQATNSVKLEPKIVACKVVAQDPIERLSISAGPLRIKIGSNHSYIAVGESLTVQGKIAKGSSVYCNVDFGEETLRVLIDLEFTVTFTYRRIGNYVVGVTCKNRVSRAFEEYAARIVVQKDERITDLRVHVDATAKGNVSVFNLTTRGGRAFVCDWYFGDGCSTQSDVSEIHNPVHHLYLKEGAFNTTVQCYNRHGTVETHATVWIQLPIAELQCKSLQTQVATLMDAQFNISFQSGSEITVQVDFQNSRKDSFHLQGAYLGGKYFVVSHSYTVNGSFQAQVYAFNLIGKVNTFCAPVLVQNPLKNLSLTSNSPVKLKGQGVFFSLKTTNLEALPSDATCSWYFGDNSSLESKVLLFDSQGIYDVAHVYLIPGSFVTRVVCANNVSIISLNSNVTVFKLDKPVLRALSEACQDGSANTTSKKYFALGDTVSILVNSQMFDKAYYWSLTGYLQTLITEEPCLSLTLNQTGAITIFVSVDKIVETMTTSTEVIVQEVISFVNFTSNGFTWLRYPTYFEIFTPIFLEGTCFDVQFNDSSGMNISSCANYTHVQNSNSRNVSLSFQHMFTHVGNYTVCLVIFNKVSQEQRCLEIIVRKPPCQIKNVLIENTDGLSGGSLRSVKYNKSSSFTLQGRYINKCLLPTSRDVLLLWKVNGTMSENNFDFVKQTEGPEIVNDARSLDYGVYYFVFTVELTSSDVKLVYGKVAGETWVRVEIVRSPIVGRIAGNRTREKGIEETLELDASDFHDPDLPPGSDHVGLNVTWFCEIFQQGPTQAGEEKPSTVCDSGVQNLNDYIRGKDNRFVSMPLETLTINITYVFRVEVSKGSRFAHDEITVKVLPRGPPAVEISVPNYIISSTSVPDTVDTQIKFIIVNKPTSNVKVGQLCAMSGSLIKRVRLKKVPFVRVYGRRNVRAPYAQIGRGECPTVFINPACCLGRNCSLPLLPSVDLTLEARCLSKCGILPLQYHWTLSRRNGGKWSVLELSPDLNIDANKKQLIITSHIFQDIVKPGRTCRVQLEVHVPGGRSGYFSKELWVNARPMAGSCVCHPTSGEFLNTKFRVKCSGWKDSNLPLKYRLSYGENGKFIPTSSEYPNLSEYFTIKEIPADGSSPFSIRISVSVEDSLGMSSKRELYVKVSKPKQEPANLMVLMDDLPTTSLNNMPITDDEDGNAQSMTHTVDAIDTILFQMRISSSTNDELPSAAAATILEATAGANAPEGNELVPSVGRSNNMGPIEVEISSEQRQRAAIVETSVNILSTVTKSLVKRAEEISLHDVAAVIDVLRTATEKEEELTLKARVNTPDSMLSETQTAEILDQLSEAIVKNQDFSLSDVERLASTILSCSSNLMSYETGWQLVSWNDSTARCDHTVKEGNLNASIKAMQVIDRMCSALLKSKKMGDPATVVETDSITAKVLKGSASSLANERMEQKYATVKFPAEVELLWGVVDTDVGEVSYQTVGYKANPYRTCERSDEVTSAVVNVEVKDSEGDNLHVQELKYEIDIRIQIPQSAFYLENKPFAMPLDDLPLQFHAFNLTSVDDPVGIAFYSENVNVSYWTLTISSKKTSQAQQLVSWIVKSDERVLLIPALNTFEKEGIYYVGVQATSTEYSRSSEEADSDIFNASYALVVSKLRCVFWNETTQGWSGDGCQIGQNSSLEKMQCLCNHLTSFAAQVMVSPSWIDFDKVPESFLELSENTVVFSTVLTVFGIYLLFLFWVRRRDVQDAKKAEAVQLADNNLFHRFKYEVTVFTGMRQEAGTTSDVCIVLVGTNSETNPRILKDPSEPRFQRCGIDSFVLTAAHHLGDLTKIVIWHNNSGNSPSWYLKQIIVRDVSNRVVFVFVCNRWLAVEYDDGQVLRELPAVKQGDIKSFNYLFPYVSQKNMADSHLWFSVFIRPQRSTFTVVQRLSCCLALLYTFMLANAIFYNLYNESHPTTTINLGLITFSACQIYIGVVTSLIVFPLNLCVVGVFKNIRPRENVQLKRRKANGIGKVEKLPRKSKVYDGKFEDIIQWYRCQNDSEAGACVVEKTQCPGMPPVENVDDGMIAFSWQSARRHSDNSQTVLLNAEQSSLQEICNASKQKKAEDCAVELRINESAGKLGKKRLLFPHWFVYVAWLAVFFITFVSSFFVILYGFQFGKEKASQWLASLLISCFQDIFITQPIKVLIAALYVALIVKKVDEQAVTEDDSSHCMNEYKSSYYDCGSFDVEMSLGDRRAHAWKQSAYIQPPSSAELHAARKKRTREIRMCQIVKEMVSYVLFLTALFMVSYGHRDPQSFSMAKLMENTFLGGAYVGQQLYEIDGVNNYWKWIEETVLPSLSSSSRAWARGCQPLQEYTADCHLYLAGGARLRQLRVAQGSCKVHELLKEKLSHCNDLYSMLLEDKEDYSPGWRKRNVSSNSTTSPWCYQTTNELYGLPYLGVMGTYSGGGYSLNLNFANNSLASLASLMHNSWIDERTRAIFLEIAVYSAQANLFGVATFLTEWLPTNGVVYFNNVKVARLYQHGDGSHLITILCEIFLGLFFVVFMYLEFKKARREGKAYFKDSWNWLEITQVVLIAASAFALFQRTVSANASIQRMTSNSEQFTSFIKAVYWDELFVYLLAFLVFFANLKLLKLMRFNHRIFLLTRTLSIATRPLFSFFAVFFCVYIAYSLVFYAVFGSELHEYSSFVSTVETLFSTMMGGFDFETTWEHSPLLGPILFFSFMMVIVMVLLNIFLTILIDCFAEVQADDSLRSKDYEVVEYMIQRIKSLITRSSKVGNVAESRQTTSRCSNSSHTNEDGTASATLGRTYSELRDDRSKYANLKRHSLCSSESLNRLCTLKTELSELSEIACDDQSLERGTVDGNSIVWPTCPTLYNAESSSRSTMASNDQRTSFEILKTDEALRRNTSIDINLKEKCENCQTNKAICPSLEETTVKCEKLSDSHSTSNGSEGIRTSAAGHNPPALSVENEHSITLRQDFDKLSYYDFLERLTDNLKQRKLSISARAATPLDLELNHLYELLNQSIEVEDWESAGFNFENYQFCFNNDLGNLRSGRPRDENPFAEMEGKLEKIPAAFAAVGISDIDEDQFFEKIVRRCVFCLNCVSFDSRLDTSGGKHGKGGNEKAKWMYTRNMFTTK